MSSTDKKLFKYKLFSIRVLTRNRGKECVLVSTRTKFFVLRPVWNSLHAKIIVAKFVSQELYILICELRVCLSRSGC
jgi:hypothetical protein